MLKVMVAVLVMMCGPVWAQDLIVDVKIRIINDPERFVALAGDLIHGFGSARGIDLAGVENFVALERAAAGAAALRRLQLADLDIDGAVTRDEVAVLVASVAATARGRLWALHGRADGDGDGTVSAGEMLAFARIEALNGFDPMAEAQVRHVLTFDADKDGFATLDEVKAGVAALGT